MTGQMKAVVDSEVKGDLPGDCLDPPGPGSPGKIGQRLVTPPRRRVEA